VSESPFSSSVSSVFSRLFRFSRIWFSFLDVTLLLLLFILLMTSEYLVLSLLSSISASLLCCVFLPVLSLADFGDGVTDLVIVLTPFDMVYTILLGSDFLLLLSGRIGFSSGSRILLELLIILLSLISADGNAFVATSGFCSSFMQFLFLSLTSCYQLL